MSRNGICVVTGAAGFIGSHMVDLLLAEGYSVRAIDNLYSGRLDNLKDHEREARLTFEEKDILNLSVDDSVFADARYIIHFAGIGDIVPSIDHPVEYLSTNVMGTVNVLEAARHARVAKFVYAASSSCYGLAKEVPTTEQAEISPQYPYALSKYMGEEAALHWGKVYHLPVNSIRIFNAYGLRSRTSGVYGAVFGVFLTQKLAGKPFTVVGDGTQKRDFIYVTDVVRAFKLAAETDKVNEIYNLSTGNPQSINRLVELLEGDVVYVPKRPGEPDCTWANKAKISQHLGWEAHVTFEQGVEFMLQNIDYWRQAPVWDRGSIQKATEGWFQALGEE